MAKISAGGHVEVARFLVSLGGRNDQHRAEAVWLLRSDGAVLSKEARPGSSWTLLLGRTKHRVGMDKDGFRAFIVARGHRVESREPRREWVALTAALALGWTAITQVAEVNVWLRFGIAVVIGVTLGHFLNRLKRQEPRRSEQ